MHGIETWGVIGMLDANAQSLVQALKREGLSISEEQVLDLADRRRDALRETGRVEIGVGPLPLIAERIAPSPYVRQETLFDDLAELQDTFYELRGEMPTCIPDIDIVDHLMRRYERFSGATETACSLDFREALNEIEGGLLDEFDREECANEPFPLPMDNLDLAYKRLRDQWEAREFGCGWDGESWYAEGDDCE